jgi:hypothetical protein
LLLHIGLRFTNVIISLSLKFRLLAFKLEKLQSTMWLWLFWKCQRTFDYVQSSLSTTLLKNQQLVHHLIVCITCFPKPWIYLCCV